MIYGRSWASAWVVQAHRVSCILGYVSPRCAGARAIRNDERKEWGKRRAKRAVVVARNPGVTIVQ